MGCGPKCHKHFGIPQTLTLVGFTRGEFLCFVFFLPCHMASGILVPRPGIEPRPLAVKLWSPNHWTGRDRIG